MKIERTIHILSKPSIKTKSSQLSFGMAFNHSHIQWFYFANKQFKKINIDNNNKLEFKEYVLYMSI